MEPARTKVHPYEYEELNKQFYSASPHRFFQRRLLGLVAVASESDALKKVFSEGISYRELTLQLDSDEDEPDKDDYTADMYAAAESTVLLHHTAEALLRLYLGHSNRNPCPWLAIASLTSFANFKKQIKKLQVDLDQSDTMDDVLEVFSYSSTPEFLRGPDPTDVWNEHRECVRDVLSEAIRILLGDANVYNSTKHGMAVVAAETGMSVGKDDEDPFMEMKGMSLKYLENVLVQQENAKYWQTTTWWPQPERAMTLTLVMTWLMRSLWQSARAHYKIDRLTEVPFLLRREQIDHLLKMGYKEGFNVTSMSMRLYTDPPTPAPGGAGVGGK